MTNYLAKNVDDFIKRAAPEARPHLKEIREAVLAAVSDIEEGISYGKPYYKYHGMVGGFDAYKQHIGVEIWSDKLDKNDREELEKRGYKTGSRTFQVKFDQKVPVDLIKKMFKKQAKKNEPNAK